MDKKQRKKNFGATIGTVLVDVGKLAIAGLIFGTIIREEFNALYTIVFGAAFAIPVIVIGIILIANFKE